MADNKKFRTLNDVYSAVEKRLRQLESGAIEPKSKKRFSWLGFVGFWKDLFVGIYRGISDKFNGKDSDIDKENPADSKPSKPEPAIKATGYGQYGNYEQTATYSPYSAKKTMGIGSSRVSRTNILAPGARGIDYIINFPTVLRRLFIDLRDPIPILDKLLFIILFFVFYFLTIIGIVVHYKYIKPDTKLSVQIGNKQVEFVVKEEDIPILKRTLGDDWLQKIGQRHLNSD